ncbi:hypothetical protein A8C56_06970 [Niabella ginsenosidivorans]|uniref:Uncharacterized protein n=2 Tax=Niabella ginsenosidivorans TaxID=1176587 RepID=A0A1A9I2F4_9BACT|nr:hypothetical protein A8C56_06970 [Niabella ginsenosidivorans]
MCFLAHNLKIDDYGAYQRFWVQLSVFNIITTWGLHLSLPVFSPEQIIDFMVCINKRQWTIISILTLISGAVFGILQWNQHIHFFVAMIVLMASAVAMVFEAILLSLKKFRFVIVVNFLYALSFLAIHLIVLKGGWHLDKLVILLASLLVLKNSITAVFLRKWMAKSGKKDTSEAEYKKHIPFFFQMYTYAVLTATAVWLDKFLISLLLKNEETAIYVNGTYDIPFLPLVFTAVGSAALMSLTNTTDYKLVAQTIYNNGRLLSCIAFPLFFYLFFFSREIIVFLFSEKYLASVGIFLFSILVIPVRANIHTTGLQYLKRGDIINYGALMDIVLAVILMPLLYFWIGLKGIALAFVISTYVQSAYYTYKSSKYLHTPVYKFIPFINWSGKLLLALLVMYFVKQAITPDLGLLTQLLLGAFFLVALSLALICFDAIHLKRKLS